MMLRWFWTMICCLLAQSFVVASYCDDPSPAFPLPDLDSHHDALEHVRRQVTHIISDLSSDERFNATSFSLEVTSTQRSLLSEHHTAEVRSKTFPGTRHVDGRSLYRIASMTKPFTVLAILQQHAAGNLRLDDTVNKYIPALNGPQKGSIPWHEITIRALASQISGIPRDLAQSDLASQPEIALGFGLPPVSAEGLPQCDSIVNYTRRCTAHDLTEWVKRIEPLFAPNQRSTYSNINYDLLSLVIENVTGQSYPEYVQTRILDPLDMRFSTFDTPQESSMVIPAGVEYYWNFDIGVQKATGGLYSSTHDLSKFLRYALTHYNAQTSAVNWFQPTSWSASMQSFYGMPWEIFRSNSYLPHSNRPITMVTKSGGLPGYTSIIIMIPEYGLGVSILVAGDGRVLAKIRDAVVPLLVRHADDVAQKSLIEHYAGIYTVPAATGLNSSMTLFHDREHGLVVESLISNGTDSLSALVQFQTQGRLSVNDFVFHVIPTFLYQDEKTKQGERWRIVLAAASHNSKVSDDVSWDNFCFTDVDPLSYGGLPVNEVIFSRASDDSSSETQVELTAFKIVLHRSSSSVTVADKFNEEL